MGATADPEVALVVSPRDWSQRLHRFCADHGGLRVRARVLDGRDALEEHFAVLVADDLTSFLTRRFVAQLRARGRRVVGVFDPDEPWGKDRLLELGVDDVIDAAATPEEMVALVRAVAAETTADDPPALTGPTPAAPIDRADAVLVVGASRGAGTTEVAISLALAATRRQRVILLDGDLGTPSLAQRLGLPLQPNLQDALEGVTHADALPRDSWLPVRPRLGVIAGASSHAALRREDVLAVSNEAAAHGHVVIDGSGWAESAGDDAAMKPASVVLVALGSPVGLARLVEAVARLRPVQGARVHVVFNRTPTNAFAAGELREELCRSFVPTTITFAPYDPRVTAAAWSASLVTRGPFARQMDALARIAASPRAGAAR